MSIGFGSGSSSGIRNGVPSGNTPATRRSPTLPMLRKSRSNSISVKPQLCGTSGLAPCLDVALEVALLLLEVLRLQEQPFGPDNPVMGRHSHQTRRETGIGHTSRTMDPGMRHTIYNE